MLINIYEFLFLIVLIFCVVYFVKWIYEKVFPKIEKFAVVKKSGIIFGAGRGVFAEKNYKKGSEIIAHMFTIISIILMKKVVNYYG